jgi:hypothetical protein
MTVLKKMDQFYIIYEREFSRPLHFSIKTLGIGAFQHQNTGHWKTVMIAGNHNKDGEN